MKRLSLIFFLALSLIGSQVWAGSCFSPMGELITLPTNPRLTLECDCDRNPMCCEGVTIKLYLDEEESQIDRLIRRVEELERKLAEKSCLD